MRRLSVLWTKNKVRLECTIRGVGDPLVANLSLIAQECGPNSIYVAIEGLHHDGHSFIDEAIERGAVAVIHSAHLPYYDPTILYIQHPNPRRVTSLFASTLYGPIPPYIVGVTGTDGKSTTCEFLWQFLNASNIRCGLLSTTAYDDGSGKRESPYRQSTPEAPQIYSFLANCAKNGVEVVILEATSHGLSAEASRLADITFSGAIVTSLSSEHLEYHTTHERYVDAKVNLVRQLKEGGWLVLPQELPHYNLFLKEGIKILPHSLEAHLRGSTLKEGWDSRVIALDGGSNITLPYGQLCYASNALGAYLGAKEVVKGEISLDKLEGVAGRFEVVTTSPFLIIVDFAHTGEAYELLFSHLKNHFGNKKLVALFGSGGERDRQKRFALGQSSGHHCSAIFITDEDPRGEERHQIENDIIEGIEATSFKGDLFKIYGRGKAVAAAFEYCDSSSILLLLGKGHESAILHANHQEPWSERGVVEELLKGGKR